MVMDWKQKVKVVRGLCVAALALCLLPNPAARAETLEGEGGGTVQIPKTERLDDLFRDLRDADSETEAERIEKSIFSLWSQSGSATVDLLMDRATAVRVAGDDKLAMSLLNRIVDLKPDYAEGYHQRSLLYLTRDNYTDAMVDLQQTLTLEPRHFLAIRTLGDILRETGDIDAALKAYSMALELNPYLEDVRKIIADLNYQVGGRGI